MTPRSPVRIALSGAVWLLVFASVVSWRKGVLYSGGVDPVVLAKAVVAAFAALAALVLWKTAPARRALSPFPVLLVAAIVGISLLGAQAEGTIAVNIVLVVRIALLATTVVLLLSAETAAGSIVLMLTAMTAVALFSAGTGLAASLLGPNARGRLEGGIPPLEPNELAALLLPSAIALCALLVRRGLQPLPIAGLVLLTGLIYETGSRTALAMLGVGAVVSLLVVRRLTRGTLVLALLTVLGVYAVVMFSHAVQDLALRGEGADRLLTLNSRTIAWSQVLATPMSSWSWWLGDGLAVKSIHVYGHYWTTQVFDSSWISSLAQDGVIGTALLVAYTIGTIVAAARRPELRNLALPIVATLVIRSVVENGLIESSTIFVVFFVLALNTWPGTAPALSSGFRERPERWAFLRANKVLVRPSV